MNVNHKPRLDDPGLDLDQFLPYRLTVLATRVSRALAAEYGARFGISIPEWRVLAHLARGGKVSVREIHEHVNMDKPKVSRAAARLEAAGLIRKTPGASDRRLVALSLTRSGRSLYRRIAALALDYERGLLDALSPEERRCLTKVLNRLDRHLDAADVTGRRAMPPYRPPDR